MTLAHSLLCPSSLLVLALAATAACEVDKNLGDLDGTSATDSASSGTDTSAPPTTTAEETGTPGSACPDNPDFTCSVPLDCSQVECGGPLSEIDDEGCLRPRCDGGQCPAGYTCVDLGAWGSCAPSFSGCEGEGDECGCGGTADCSDSVSLCVQDEAAPPAACNDFTDEAACLAAGCSAFVLAPQVEFDDVSGTCSCAEVEPTCLWFPSGNQGGDPMVTPYVAFDAEGQVVRLLPAGFDENPLGWRRCTDVLDDAVCACAQALSCP